MLGIDTCVMVAFKTEIVDIVTAPILPALPSLRVTSRGNEDLGLTMKLPPIDS